MMTRIPGHPLADPDGRIAVHAVVLYGRIGPGWHPCHWCGKRIEWRPVGAPRKGRLVPDHLDGDPRNNDPANLVPACSGCNSGRGLPNRIAADESVLVRGGTRHRAERRRCIRCSTEFLHRIAAKSPGLYCSKACSNRENRHPDAIREGELFITPLDGKRVRAVEQQCAKCGRTFLARVSVVKAGGGRYCSKSCIDRRPKERTG